MPVEVKDMFNAKYPNLLKLIEPYLITTHTITNMDDDWWEV